MVPGKKFFKVFLPYMGMAAILVSENPLFPREKPKLQNLNLLHYKRPRGIICIDYDKQESPMLHTKFRQNRSRRRFLKVFFTIYGNGGHLGYRHVTSIMLISMYPKAYLQNLVKNGPVVTEKSKF